MKDHITVQGQDGTFTAYIARPKTLPAPAVVVLQELFGVNADIRKTCDELAEQGFVAVAPDLFWRQEPGVDLNVTSEADWQHGLRLYQAYDEMPASGILRTPLTRGANCLNAPVRLPSSAIASARLMTFLTAVRYDGSMPRSRITAVTPRNTWARSTSFMRPC